MSYLASSHLGERWHKAYNLNERFAQSTLCIATNPVFERAPDNADIGNHHNTPVRREVVDIQRCPPPSKTCEIKLSRSSVFQYS